MGVISLASRKPEPTNAGEAKCLACGREWIAVAPISVIALECPSCGMLRGLFKYLCEREGPHWQCNCGNKLFRVTPEGYYCPNCGEWQHGF